MNANREPASANTPAHPRYRVSVAAAAALVTAGMAGVAWAGTGQVSAATRPQWAMMAGNIQQLSRRDPATTAHFFNTPSAFGAGASLVRTPVQRGYAATPVLYYTSYARFASDVANGAISYPYKWVMYDPEHRASTPVSEQQDPKTYLRRFGRLGHAHGLKIIMAPSRDLGAVPGSKLPRQRRESIDRWYIRVGIASAAATYGDAYVVQDEMNAASLPEYDWLYNSAAAQARGARSGVKVFSEVAGDCAGASQMVAAAKSISPDGYFVATAGQTSRTAQFFQDMKAAGY